MVTLKYGHASGTLKGVEAESTLISVQEAETSTFASADLRIFRFDQYDIEEEKALGQLIELSPTYPDPVLVQLWDNQEDAGYDDL